MFSPTLTGALFEIDADGRNTFAVTGVLQTGPDTFSHVPGLVWTGEEIRAALTDNGHGVRGWFDVICNECGDTLKWCPVLKSFSPDHGSYRD